MPDRLAGSCAVHGPSSRWYAWFATAASLPILSIDADRAARRIVDAVLAGRPMVVLTPLAWLGIRVRGLAPATTTRLMGLVNRSLPAAPATAGPVRSRGARSGHGRDRSSGP